VLGPPTQNDPVPPGTAAAAFVPAELGFTRCEFASAKVLGNFQKPSPPNWAGNRIGTGAEVKARKFLFSFGALG